MMFDITTEHDDAVMPLSYTQPPHGEMPHREEMHECVVCGQAVAPDRKFCCHCGAPQWEECLKCGEPVSPKDHFCGGCGVDLARLLEQRRRELIELLEKAREHELSFQLDEAIAAYREVAEAKQLKFRKLAEGAAEHVAELTQRCEKVQAESRAIYDAAAALIDDHRHAEALSRLKAVPAACRTEAMTLAIDEIERVEREVARIEKDIARAVDGDRMDQALDLLHELLTLRPKHPKGRALAERLCDGMLTAVKTSIAEYDYPTARQMLESVPESLRTRQLREELERVRQLDWMVDELIHSSHVDKQLVTVAGVLYRATPQDPRVVWHCKKLKGVILDIKEKPDWPRAPWAPESDTSTLGCPVVPLFQLDGVRLAETANHELLASQADRFTVACGLAIQGLRKAVVPLNMIVPPKRSKMLGLLPSPPPREVWGIDCGRHALKAVRAVIEPGQPGVVIREAVYIPYGGGVDHSSKDSLQSDSLKRTLAVFRERHLNGDFGIHIALPGSDVLCRNFSLPEANPKKTEQAVELEAKHLLPGKVEQFRWRFIVSNSVGARFGLNLPRRDGKAPQGDASTADVTNERQKIFLVATRFDALRKFMEMLQRCGIRPDSVTPDAIANFNYFAHERLAKAGEGVSLSDVLSDSFLICDMGALGANLIAYADSTIVHSFISTGGAGFTKAVCRLRNMTFEQAEDFKRSANTVSDLMALHSAWTPVADLWSNDVRRRVQMMLGADTHLDRAHLVGGGFRLHGLIRHIRREE